MQNELSLAKWKEVLWTSCARGPALSSRSRKKKIKDQFAERVSKLGENIQVRRFVRFVLGAEWVESLVMILFSVILCFCPFLLSDQQYVFG